MKNDEDFSIITVNSENDEEIVIQAGILKKPVEQDTLEAESNLSAESEDSFAAIDDAYEVSAEKKKEVYQGVTEADLDDAGPYNKMRLIIIICGFLFLAGFIVYFLFLR